MAGDIEERFRFNFQADSLHSGSISFGRFANEDLCWERRSSFSHNKYLEEVEKYSKPGSVTEKKAILEAHFKKRALLSQTSGNKLSENAHFENVNDVCQSAQFGVIETGYEVDFENFNDYSYSTQSRDGSAYDGEHELTECEREHHGFSYSEPRIKPGFDHEDTLGVASEHFQEEEEEGCCPVTKTVNPEESEIHMKEEYNGEGNNSENVTSNTDVPIPTSHKIDKDGNTSSEPLQKFSPKVKSASQTKHLKSRSSLVNAAKASPVVSKEATKELSRKPRQNSDISVREKLGFQPIAAPTYCSMSRTPKHEVSSSSKSKVHKESRSNEKETMAKETVVHKVHQSANRHKKDVASTTPSMKQNCSSFSFKSEERAERRKEFLMKIEEKMHAKEAEMHQLQTRKQEKSEAEIRRLRRSLNFKATPMPSFYHEAGQQSDRNKNLTNKSRSSRPQSKHSSPSTIAAENDTSDGSETSALPTCSNIRATLSQTEARVGKNEHEKKQLVSMRKPKTPSKVEGKPNVSPRRTSNNVVKKGIKGIRFGTSSRIDCLAVGVAS